MWRVSPEYCRVWSKIKINKQISQTGCWTPMKVCDWLVRPHAIYFSEFSRLMAILPGQGLDFDTLCPKLNRTSAM